MDIKKELKIIIGLIDLSTTTGYDDAGENGSKMAAMEDFNPTSEDSTAREEEDFEEQQIDYNGWYQRLQRLYDSL